MAYLEGDERVYVDGSRSPAVYGTGTEDYFNGGWYFILGEFSLPYHGNPYQSHRSVDHDLTTSRTHAYRFHLSDVIPFQASLRFGIEHDSNYDGNNQDYGTYSSVAYYYKTGGEAPGLVLTADLDVGNEWSKGIYGYQPPAAGSIVSNTWNYEGDDDDVDIADAGYQYSEGATSVFTVMLIDNAGMQLRRRTDQGTGGQRAQVFVDDACAGVWYEGDYNYSGTSNRWLDSEFLIHSNLVAGKTSAQIRIVPMPSSAPWNEYRYKAYCIKPFEIIEDIDTDGLPDEWELEQAPSLYTLSRDNDEDGDGLTDYSEYIAGTQPTNASSSFSIKFNDGIAVESKIGRLYHLQQRHSLNTGVWETVRSNVPGTGSSLVMPVKKDVPASYFCLQVEKP
jgi:hypothetical protein